MVTYLLVSLLGGSCHFGEYCDRGDPYSLIFDEALYNCPNARGSEESNIDTINLLMSIESEYDLPCSLRGMLLAAACHESGYNPNALGDRKFSKKNSQKNRKFAHKKTERKTESFGTFWGTFFEHFLGHFLGHFFGHFLNIFLALFRKS